MDIEVLLWFQTLRAALGPGVEAAVAALSDIAAGVVTICIPLVIYWCADKTLGSELAFAYGISYLSNQTLKNTVCCYRPWVRDARIQPAQAAIRHATGYSFPSGHTQTAASLYGGIGASRKVPKALRVICWAYAIFVPFSRCFLGVHTPQDVIVGFAEGIVGIFLARMLLGWVGDDQGRVRRVALIGLAVTAAFLAYTALKPYPLDYIDGELAADPADMIVDCFSGAGFLVGMLVGWLCERRFVRFSTADLKASERILRLVIGLLCVVLPYVVLKTPLASALGRYWGTFACYCLVVFGGIFVAPAIFEPVGRRIWKEDE